MQDSALAANVHQIRLRSAPWYRDRFIGSTTLGSLMVVVLLRTAHSNLAKLQVPSAPPPLYLCMPHDLFGLPSVHASTLYAGVVLRVIASCGEMRW